MVLAYDLLEDRRTDDNSAQFKFFLIFWILNLNQSHSIATNQFSSFFIDIRSRQCYFRVCQCGEILNKRAFFPCILIFLLYKTNRFRVAGRLFSNRSQRTSKNISDTLSCALCATFLFLPRFDVICDLLLNRRTATWNLFVKLKNYEGPLIIYQGGGLARMRGEGHDQSRGLEEGIITQYIEQNVRDHLIYCLLLMTVAIKIVHNYIKKITC